jgi:hypothetical protein
MNEAAWLSVLNTAGAELPPRSRITTTTLRLPFWFRANDGRGGILSDLRASRSRRSSRHPLPPSCLLRRQPGPSFPIFRLPAIDLYEVQFERQRLAHVCFGAHYGQKTNIARGPNSANSDRLDCNWEA